ncbi:MAG: sel1 repeat family protein, partial [bacterium]|nr:sel1 repeat family protein [bacterium]
MSHTKQVDYIYNPLNQTPEELRRSFVVREKEFNTIFNDIKTSKMKHPEPHYVVQGKRGQGKTTLLLKLYYEIKEDKTLSKFIVPVIFNEEQYHINSLFGLWSHTAEKLEEENELFLGLYDAVEDAYDHGNSELDAFKCLESTLKKEKKKLVLFVDNVGQLFKKLNKREQQRLREVFIACPEIRIFGASAEILEHTYDYSKPFYELFRFINLEGLTQNEAEALLLKLGEHYKQDNIKKIIQKEPGRIEALRRLTGGVPRTIVLLFEIFVDHKDGDSFLDLEVVLDRVTPLYKHRMDDLPVQQQKIVDAIALHWDAMAVKQIASKTRMESKAVSSQLKLLEKKRIVHKITTTTKNHFYQVSERFFNIWYLMRYGRRRGKNRVQWLVRFLECWCSGSELEDRTQQHIDALKKGTLHTKHALYFTEALARTKIPDQLQHKLIYHARSFLKVKDKTLIEELTKSNIEILQEANILYCKNEFKKALQVLESVQNKSSRVMSFKVYLLYKMGAKDFEEVEDYYLQEIRNGDADAMNNIAVLYELEAKDFQ